MNRGLPLALLLGGCVATLPDVADPCAAWDEPGLYRLKIDPDDSRTRKTWVYVPPQAGPRDIVVMLHGGAQSSRKFSDVTSFIPLAREEGFVAVFPDGLGWPLRSWNAGACCGTTGEDRRNIGDAEFLDQLVRELSPRVCGDRVLASGFSNGAMMAHRWACEGEAVDAVAPVAGPLTSEPDRCDGAPLPIRHYHGTADTVVPAKGGSGGTLEEHHFRSVEETMAVWRGRNQCTDDPPVFTRIGEDTMCAAWTCGAPTELCLIEGWPHAWPGGIHAERTDADATRTIWSWFNGLQPG